MSDLDSNTLGVLTNLGIGAAIFISVLLLFDLLRYCFPGMYYYREAAAKDPLWNRYDNTPLVALQRPSHLPFAWIPSTLAYSEAATITTHGLDVAMYLRFLATQVKVFFCLTIFTAIVLYPTYITADNRYLPDGNPSKAIGIELVSLSNVPDKSSRLWVTLIADLIVVAIICWFLYRDIQVYTKYRREYRSSSSNPSNYAVIILDIPEPYRQSEKIQNVFESIFPQSVVAVHVVYNAENFYALKQKYVDAVAKLERAQWDVTHDPQAKRPSISLSELNHVDPDATDLDEYEQVDAIEFWRKQTSILRKSIETKQQDLQQIAPLTHAAIVVFRTKKDATCAVTAPIWGGGGEWKISRAGEPRAVNWDRLDITNWTTRIRSYISGAALIAVALFWTIPSSFIQALGNFTKLADEYDNSFLADLANADQGLVRFLEGILPPLLLFLVLLLVPLIMRFVISFERIHSRILVESKIRNYLFFFYVTVNFFYVILIGSVLKQFREILDNPTKIVSFLSTSVPAQSTFLMKYVLINAFLGSAVGMLNIGRLLIRPFTMRNKRTLREKRNGDGIFAQYPFGKLYALCTMISLISFVYSTIAPLICLVALLYYSIAYLCTKHLLLYGHRPLFEGGGYLFRDAWTGLLVGLYVHQVSMIGIFILKLALPQAILGGISFVFSIWMTMYCRQRYLFPAKHGTLFDQCNGDEENGLVDEIPDHFPDLYIHPGLKTLDELVEIGSRRQDEQPQREDNDEGWQL